MPGGLDTLKIQLIYGVSILGGSAPRGNGIEPTKLEVSPLLNPVKNVIQVESNCCEV